MGVKKPLFTLGLMGFVAGCSGAQKAGPAKVIGVRVDRMIPSAESLEASAITVRLELYNPRSTGVAIRRVEYALDTGNVAGVLEGASESGETLEAGQSAELEFKERVRYPDEAEAYREILDRGTLPVTVRGNVFFGDGTRVPFERAGEVATPLLPKMVVHDAQAARYGQDGIDVTFFLRLLNENVFTVTVEALEYSVFINDKKMKSEQAAGVTLVSGAVQEFEVSTPLDATTYDDVKGLLAAGELNYRVAGTVSHSRLETPFEFTGDIKMQAD